MQFRRVIASIVAIVVCAHLALAADQPQFGQRHTRNMVSEETGLPDSFDVATGKNIKWTADLGSESYATPVIASGRIFIGTNNNNPRDPRHIGDRGILLCLNEADGKMLWQLVVPKLGPDVYLDWPNAGLCSPPTVEGDRAYGITNRGEVVCLDPNGLANGNDGPYVDEARHQTPSGKDLIPLGPTDADIIWLFDIPNQAGTWPHDSAHASILLDGDLLYINTSNGVDNTHRKIRRPDGPSLIVLDKKTGRWLARDDERIGPRIVHSTWSSPAMGQVNGRNLVFFGGGNGIVYAFNALTSIPASAEVMTLTRIWRFDCDPAAPTDDVHKYMGNRRISASNIKSMPVFQDGRVYVTVGGDIWWGKSQSWLKCIDASKTGDIASSGQIWSYEMPSQCCTTPAVRDGLIFVGDCARTLHCVDAATGKGLWTYRMRGPIWSSPMIADGKVYVGSQRGDLCIFALAREQKLLFSHQFESGITATPVAANRTLYIGTQTRLYALSLPN